MDMILLDWTRMGRAYCIAGAVWQDQQWRIVRPLLTNFRQGPVRTVGWSAYLLDGHVRWEIMELIGPQPATPEPPHVEDLWVRSLRFRGATASLEQRRAILTTTLPRAGESLFGSDLATTRTAVYQRPGTGARSLATLLVPSDSIHFVGVWREGCAEPDIRASLTLPDWGNRSLPVKDHHLLRKAEQAGPDIEQRIQFLTAAVQRMGDPVAVRLGLSRPFVGRSDLPGMCWVMADGFFSLMDPQP